MQKAETVAYGDRLYRQMRAELIEAGDRLRLIREAIAAEDLERARQAVDEWELAR